MKNHPFKPSFLTKPAFLIAFTAIGLTAHSAMAQQANSWYVIWSFNLLDLD